MTVMSAYGTIALEPRRLWLHMIQLEQEGARPNPTKSTKSAIG